MANITLNNSIYKKLLQINSRYSIQNLEFYPKVRELQFVGDELGIYDSLGFVAEDGEYDYVITSIDYEDPQMSVEVNASTNIFVDPGSITNSILSKINSETFLFISENSSAEDKRNVYLLDPDYLRNEEYTLYGKRIFDQVIWLDILPRKLLCRLDHERSEVVDQRYNDKLETERTEASEIMFRMLKLWNSNIEISYENKKETESRFDLDIATNNFTFSVQNQIHENATLKSSVEYSSETGSEQGMVNEYEIKTWKLEEILIWSFGKRYRFYSRFSYKNNKREGFGFTSYIDKIDGDIFKWNSSFNYRVNSYTFFSVEYSGNSYPLRDSVHKLRMEIRAEF